MKRTHSGLVLLLSFIAVLSGCMKDDNRDEEKIAENEATIEAYLKTDSAGSSAVRDSSGLYYIIRKSNPNGTKVKRGEVATVKFSGYLLNGTKVLSVKNDSLYSFPAGGNATGFAGLERGIFLMKTGEKASFFLPFYLGFGNIDRVNVPAYSPIRLEVEFIRTRTEVQQIEDYITEKKFVVSERTSDNLFIIRTNTVTGDFIGAGKSVNVKYTGKRLDGSLFDEGTFSMTTGTGGSVEGFDKAVQKMRKTEKAIVIFPSALGYGANGRGPIAPYTPLQFELEIL